MAPLAAGAVEFPTQAPLLFAATLLMAMDPRRAVARVPRPILCLAGLLVVLCAGAFLPGAMLGGTAVKDRLETLLGLQLASCVTLQPWMTLEGLLVLVVNVLWGYYLFTRTWALRRVRVIGLYCIAMTALAALSLFSFWHGWRPPFWPDYAPFGPCPNYNQTGFLFGTAGLLCFCLAFRKSHQIQQPQAPVLWLVAFLVLGVALVFNRSRSGILIYLAGPLVWLAGCAKTRVMQPGEALKLGLAVGLAGVLFAIFGGQALKRFGDVPVSPLSDYRVLIQKDALQLARNASIVGVGSGNFEAIFPFYRQASWNEKRALHPESDWACLAAELGWLAVPVAWVLLFWCIKGTFQSDGQSDSSLMLGAGLVGVSLWLHGFVDMNAHRIGAVWPLLLLLAANQPKAINEPEKHPRSLGWRIGLVGLTLLTLAAWLGPACGWNFPGTMLRRRLDADLTATLTARDYPRARQLCEQALAITPLDWRLYFQRAFLSLAQNADATEAAKDFNRARSLEPNAPELPLLEARYWWEFGWPVHASLALEEVFRRGGHTEAMFDHVFNVCRKDPGLIRALLIPAAGQPATQLRYLRDAPPELFTEMLHLVLRGPLDAWREDQRTLLFRLWAEHEERDQLPAFLAEHPEQMPLAWPALARMKLRAGEAQAACELLVRWLKPPKLPDLESSASAAMLRRRIELNPADYGAVFLLSTQLDQSGDPTAAVRVLTTALTRPGAPAYLHYLLYRLHLARREWAEAGSSWRQYDEAVLRTSAK